MIMNVDLFNLVQLKYVELDMAEEVTIEVENMRKK